MALTMTKDGKLAMDALVKSLHLTPRSVILIKSSTPPMEILEALVEPLRDLRLNFDVPVICIPIDADISVIGRKELEDALETIAKNEARFINFPVIPRLRDS